MLGKSAIWYQFFPCLPMLMSSMQMRMPRPFTCYKILTGHMFVTPTASSRVPFLYFLIAFKNGAFSPASEISATYFQTLIFLATVTISLELFTSPHEIALDFILLYRDGL